MKQIEMRMSSYNAGEMQPASFAVAVAEVSELSGSHLQLAIAQIASPAKWSKGAAWAVQHLLSDCIHIRGTC